MESLSRPPHRRKHSSTNGFSFKNPYDDVFLSNRGERESLEAHEYAEIFSGSSSIPVIDLSGLDERVGPGDCRSSKLDYANIFGGFRNGDVAVPYEELFNGSAKKSKLRTPTDTLESRSSHSSEMPKIPSGEASNQSVDGVKKQFNVSFNKTGQKNTDAANGKTHIAQLKAVPGFAYVVNETPRQQKTEDGKTVNSLKRDVSRTWSFSAEVETDKGKGGLNGKDPLIPNKPYDANDINLKSNISKVSPLSSSPSNVSGNNDPSQLRESNLVAKGKGGLNGKDSPIPNKSFNVNDVNLKSNFSKVPSLSSSPSNISGNNDPSQLREPNFVAKGEGGLDGNDSPIPNHSFDANDVNLKSNFSKVSSPSSSPSNIGGNNDPSQLRESNFVSKEESLRKDAGEFLPPYLGEDFDENSVAAASAAALKKAIDQAQESIRLAKMIMDRKKEGYQNGSKLRQRDRPEVLAKEGKTHRGSYGSEKKISKEKFEELDPTFTTFNEIAVKFTPSLSHNNTFIGDAKIEMERVWENVEAAEEHETVFLGGGKLFSSYGSERELLNIDEKVELKKTGKNVDAEEADFPVLIANECKIADLVSDKVGTSSSLLPSTSELESHPWRLETGEYNLEEREATVYHTKGSEFVAELIESPVDTSQRINVEEAEQCRATLEYAQESENKMEKVPSTSQITREQEKVLAESGKNFGISLEDHVSEERENKMDDKRNQEPEEMLVLEQFTELRSKLDYFLHESCNLGENETLGQVETESKSEVGCERKENGHIGESFEDDDHLWFESEEQLKETVEDELYDAEPGAFQETGEVENNFNETLELETENQTQNHAHDADEPRLPEELEHNKVEERHVNTFEMRAKIRCSESEARNNAVSCDSPETNYTPLGDRRTEESVNNCQYEANAYAEHIDGGVNVNSSSASTICSDVQTDDTSTFISGTQEEASNNNLDNKSEECQRGHKNYRENDTLSEATETFCVTDKYRESEHLFHLEDDNEIPGTETLRRIASEEIFVESELHDAFDSPPDGKMGHVPDLDPEDELPEDQDTSISTIEIHDVDQGYTSKINGQDLPQVHASDIREAEFDLADVRQASEQTSESDEGSVSTSSHENINGFSAHESEECGENANNVNPNSDELKDKLELVSDVGKSAEEQSEPKRMEKEKPTETERAVEKDLKTETNDENFVGSSPIEEKDVKADPQNSDKTDYQQRIEAIKRGREREKDRIVVERAIREARERAFAEARERAERAAVERAASEARQRAMTEAREKLDKASMEAKRKSERAAVERATAEARERALEKAMSQKTIRTEGKTTESVSGSSRSNGLKQSFSSSDLENVTESAQRRKARLERHQRIMERAAKALAEKNMRDLLVQKEQAERNRLAESLDADIKRWATGKEGNLRALLSTLQYILGPTSGWQPIPLTEIVTTAAVKKAYRKATLYVHPDKLQQRGASIKQKYLCEKIFDLLKAAWNRFNSDER